MVEKKCKYCGETSQYSRFSPDIGTTYFCSPKCDKKYLEGRVIRCLPLEYFGNNPKLKVENNKREKSFWKI